MISFHSTTTHLFCTCCYKAGVLDTSMDVGLSPHSQVQPTKSSLLGLVSCGWYNFMPQFKNGPSQAFCIFEFPNPAKAWMPKLTQLKDQILVYK